LYWPGLSFSSGTWIWMGSVDGQELACVRNTGLDSNAFTLPLKMLNVAAMLSALSSPSRYVEPTAAARP